jgi:hypothetical protein
MAAFRIDQRRPSHNSTNGATKPLWGAYDPTATQYVREMQEMAFRDSFEPGGFGVCWITQRDPFHCSAKVLPKAPPTAIHALCEIHATPFSEASTPPDGGGIGLITQLEATDT